MRRTTSPSSSTVANRKSGSFPATREARGGRSSAGSNVHRRGEGSGSQGGERSAARPLGRSRRRERADTRKRRSFGPAYTDLIRGRDGRYPVSPILRSERSRASKVETRLRSLFLSPSTSPMALVRRRPPLGSSRSSTAPPSRTLLPPPPLPTATRLPLPSIGSISPLSLVGREAMANLDSPSSSLGHRVPRDRGRARVSEKFSFVEQMPRC